MSTAEWVRAHNRAVADLLALAVDRAHVALYALPPPSADDQRATVEYHRAFTHAVTNAWHTIDSIGRIVHLAKGPRTLP